MLYICYASFMIDPGIRHQNHLKTPLPDPPAEIGIDSIGKKILIEPTNVHIKFFSY